jgi:hypothetical protein
MAIHDSSFVRHAGREVHLFNGKVVAETELERLEKEVGSSPCLFKTFDTLFVS